MSYFDYHCPNCQHKYLTIVGVSECPKCGQENNVEQDSIPGKGFSLFGSELPETDKASGHVSATRLRHDSVKTSSNKYPALKTIASLYKILAFVVAIATPIVFVFGVLGVVSTASDERVLGLIVVVTTIFWGPISFITLLAMSEGIMLFVNMANDLSEVKMLLDD